MASDAEADAPNDALASATDAVAAGVCKSPDAEARACGQNGRGVEARACIADAWGEWSDCEDPDDCVDGSEEDQPCGLNGRGVQARLCERGAWRPSSECVDLDVCLNGDEDLEACGVNGTGEQRAPCVDGQWGPPGACNDPDVCLEGDVEAEACGANGRGAAERACVDGQWSEFGPCVDGDDCVDGMQTVEACGLNARGTQTTECVGGAWGPAGPCVDSDRCVDGDVESRACVGGGNESRTCLRGQWGAFDGCVVVDCLDDSEPNETWQHEVVESERLPRNISFVDHQTLPAGDVDWHDFMCDLINFNLTATVSADATCGGGGGPVCAEMLWYTWVQDEELIDPTPITIAGPLCGDLSNGSIFLNAGAVGGLAGEPWTSILVHVTRGANAAPDAVISYRVDVTR